MTDTMALSMGFAEDCTERLEAAVTFELTYNENNGHVFLPKDKLLAATCQLLGCGMEQVEAALDALAEHHAVVIQRIANVEAVLPAAAVGGGDLRLRPPAGAAGHGRR